MSKFVRYEKNHWNLGGAVVLFNKVSFYLGRTDHWGIGANINLYDRSITFELLNLYFGVEIYHE